MVNRGLDIAALYARHCDELLVFLVRRTTDAEVALDIWGETFAQALASRGRYRGTTDEEAGAWLFSIARRQLARYYRRGSAERKAMRRLGIERPAIDPEIEAEIMRRAGLEDLRQVLAAAVEAGRLHDAGSGVVNGRAVRRLLGAGAARQQPTMACRTRRQPPHRRAGSRHDRSRPGRPEGGVGVPLIVLDVDSYELLPLNGSTVSLLSIRPAGNPTIYRYRAGGR
jgi:hypothetical protein